MHAPGTTSPLRVRWRIFAFLFGFGVLAYVQQKSVTIAAERIMPELGLSQMQIGWLEQAFVIGYALFQLPGGLVGQRLGARRALVLIGAVAFVAVISAPLAPYVAHGAALFAILLAAQLTLGVAQAGFFPVCAGAFEAWFPSRQWPLVQGLHTMGLGLGAAITSPLIASLTANLGWQRALLFSSLPAVALIGGWSWYGRDVPRQHPRVSAQELAELDDRGAAEVDARIGPARLWQVLKHRNALLLALAYFIMNYAFYLLSNWSFLYLVQARHFSAIESGWLASAPPLAAAVAAGVGGVLTTQLCRHYGVRWGFRLLPLISLPCAGLLLLATVLVPNAYGALAALSLSFAAVELTESAFWGGAMTVGRSEAMAVSGIMNTGGNLGGIVGIPLVAYFSGHADWRTAFVVGAVCAGVSALIWLAIEADRSVEPGSGGADLRESRASHEAQIPTTHAYTTPEGAGCYPAL